MSNYHLHFQPFKYESCHTELMHDSACVLVNALYPNILMSLHTLERWNGEEMTVHLCNWNQNVPVAELNHKYTITLS